MSEEKDTQEEKKGKDTQPSDTSTEKDVPKESAQPSDGGKATTDTDEEKVEVPEKFKKIVCGDRADERA